MPREVHTNGCCEDLVAGMCAAARVGSIALYALAPGAMVLVTGALTQRYTVTRSKGMRPQQPPADLLYMYLRPVEH
eukprot:2468825-Prymnesium_polylepis.1